jgi:hypothetical protein
MEEETMPAFEDHKIRDRAYALWDKAGQPEGREEEFWYDAERELAEEEEVDVSEEAAKLDLPPILPGGMTK